MQGICQLFLYSTATCQATSQVITADECEVQLCLVSMQEMASRGLSAVYQLADEAGRNELLNSLMGTLQGEDSHLTVLSHEGRDGHRHTFNLVMMSHEGP